MYRTAASRKPADTEVLCRRCASRTKVNLEESRNGTFTCESCGREQPVLRDTSDSKLEKVEIASSNAGSYEELVPVMASFGVNNAKVAQITFACDGISILASLNINSGTVMGLEMAAVAHGLFDIRFLRENELHRKAKAKGISIETQTGDVEFDEEVYIESKMGAENVRTVLASSAVRGAIRRLLSEVKLIQIVDGHVKIDVSKTDHAFDPQLLRERLACLRVIAGAPQPFGAVEMPVSMASTLTMVFIYSFSPVALLAFWYAAHTYGPIERMPYAIGVVAGLVLAAIVWPIYAKLLRGRSTSHRDLTIARLSSLIAGPLFMMGVLFVVNAAFDSSPHRTVDLKVVSTKVDDDDNTELHVRAVDSTGRRHSYTLKSSTDKKPKIVRVTWRGGALGWTYEGTTMTFHYDDPPPPIFPLPPVP